MVDHFEDVIVGGQGALGFVLMEVVEVSEGPTLEKSEIPCMSRGRRACG